MTRKLPPSAVLPNDAAIHRGKPLSVPVRSALDAVEAYGRCPRTLDLISHITRLKEQEAMHHE
ncbi:hypothetical protein [Azospirillum canadense]|uniref:hypothetical protein n=1 Tax=Azospirillum canadense TaxID=403962 RepID=UPI002225E492|nr:hypothetical protein [Azospirillum canadense]MCW2242309.1 hypothetical protein [Azospirillum canadense]